MYQNFETLNDLVEYLQELAEQETIGGMSVGELPVAIAHQQNWPLAERIAAVTVCAKNEERAVWLAASPSYDLDYAPRNAWEGGIEGADFPEDGEDW